MRKTTHREWLFGFIGAAVGLLVYWLFWAYVIGPGGLAWPLDLYLKKNWTLDEVFPPAIERFVALAGAVLSAGIWWIIGACIAEESR